MLKIIGPFLCILVTLNGIAQKMSQTESYIFQAMAEQEACWNNGDLSCFMKHYWKSDSLKFIGSKGITYGWQKTLDNYLVSYPDKSAMGKLTFTNLVSEKLGKDAWMIMGKWELQRTGNFQNLSGHYTLIWRKIKGNWVIVADHSS